MHKGAYIVARNNEKGFTMKNITIKTATLGVLIASALTGCVSTAVMQKSDEVASLPSMAVSVDGQFGGFGTEGTFDVAGLYKGKFTRDASSTDWFGVYGTAEGGLAAEITKVDSNQTGNSLAMVTKEA